MYNILLMHPLRPRNSNNIFYCPDLGFGYLATAIRNKFNNNINVNMLINKLALTDDEFAEYLKKGNYDFIGIKAFSTNVSSVERTISIIRKALPKAVVVVGGPQVYGDPQNVLSYISADYGLWGEGEVSMPLLISSFYTNGKSGCLKPDAAKSIPGLIWKDNEKVICNPSQILEDIDSVGMPAWDLMDPRGFPFQRDYVFSLRAPIAPIILSRGCPYTCTFCAAGKIKYRERSIRNIMEEITLLYENYGVRELNMVDSCLGYKATHLVEFCKTLVDSRLDITWNAVGGIRLDSINPEVLHWLKKSRCNQIWVGIESGSPKILKSTRKAITVEEIEKRVKLVNDAGIDITAYFILGLSGETKEDTDMTIKFAKKLNLQGAVFNIFVPVPGTSDYDNLQREGKLKDIDFDSLDQKFYENNFAEYSPQELIKLRQKVYWSFHLRPKIIFRRLRYFRQMLFKPRLLYFWIRYLMWHLLVKSEVW